MGNRFLKMAAMLPLLFFAAWFGYGVAKREVPPTAPSVENPAWQDPFWQTTYTAEEWAVLEPLACPEGMVAIPPGVVFSQWRPQPSFFERERGPARDVAAFCLDRFEYPNERFALPRTQVSWTEADRLCDEAGKRLCAEDEWERACTMTGDWPQAYGPTYVPHRCNTEQREGMSQAIAPAGSRFECRNRYSVFDLNGNVSEWVATPGVVRGGTAWRGAAYGATCFSRHTHAVDDSQWPDDGFRCCADAKAK